MEQKNVLSNDRKSGQNYLIIESTGGAGKTEIPATTKEAWENAGYKVICFDPWSVEKDHE